MKITIESTSKMVLLNGVPARVWEGQTDNGINVHCFITRIGVARNEPRISEFETQFKECRVPSPEIEAFSLRLIL